MHACSGLRKSNYGKLDFDGRDILDFCHVNDVQQLSKHHQEGYIWNMLYGDMLYLYCICIHLYIWNTFYPISHIYFNIYIYI